MSIARRKASSSETQWRCPSPSLLPLRCPFTATSEWLPFYALANRHSLRHRLPLIRGTFRRIAILENVGEPRICHARIIRSVSIAVPFRGDGTPSTGAVAECRQTGRSSAEIRCEIRLSCQVERRRACAIALALSKRWPILMLTPSRLLLPALRRQASHPT